MALLAAASDMIKLLYNIVRDRVSVPVLKKCA